MILMFLGAPGSGKGTLGRGVAEYYNIPIISSGEVLRTYRDDPEFGKAIREHQDAGVPVPDDIVMPLLKRRLAQPDCENGALFDALTYNIAQALAVDEFVKIELVVNLLLAEEVIIQKALGRRVCSKCGDPSYNVADINDKELDIVMPPLSPKIAGKCNRCTGDLVQRSDDNENTIKKRLTVYRERIAPVLDFYCKKNILKEFKVNRSPNILVPQLIKLIEDSGAA